MTLTIELTASSERRLAERAAKAGKPVEVFAREVLEREIDPVQTLNEILAPFRQSFAESGLTEEELDALVDEARKEIWAEQHGQKT